MIGGWETIVRCKNSASCGENPLSSGNLEAYNTQAGCVGAADCVGLGENAGNGTLVHLRETMGAAQGCGFR